MHSVRYGASSSRPPQAEHGTIDVEANRRSRNWTPSEQARRLLWAAIHPLFRLSPRVFWSWRTLLLRSFGARIGREVRIHPAARIAIPWNLAIGDHAAIGDRAILYALGPITIGARATVSQGAHLCAGTHDWRRPDFPLLKPPVEIGEEAWICADAFVGPGVRVGARAIVGARAVAVKDVGEDVIVAGNPARPVGRR
jgi:putative colanic acid biosynthesis acetyltransferase WcaF